MKTVAIKIRRYAGNAGNINIVNNNNLEKRILNFMFVSLGALTLCYVLFLGSMIFNIVERKSIEVEARNLSNEVGNLELQYLSMSNKVDMSLATTMGFKETKQQYATRKHLGSLSIVANEL